MKFVGNSCESERYFFLSVGDWGLRNLQQKRKKSFFLVTKQSCLVAGWKKKKKSRIGFECLSKTPKKLMPLKTPNENPQKTTLQLSISFYKLQTP